MKAHRGILGMLFVISVISTANGWADTIRVYGSSGQGYTDITTDGQGREIRRDHYGEDGVMRDHTEIDPATGTKQTTTYKEGKPEKKVTTDAQGNEREEITYDDKGRIRECTTTDENGDAHTEEYQYDDKGRVIMVNKKGAGGGITESIDYGYDEDGNLEHIIRFGHDEQGQPKVEGKISFDKDGNVTGREGNTDGLIDEGKRHLQREFGDPNTHKTRDPLGNTVIVRHNPDGSYDVTVINPEGKVISRQYHGSGRCYLGDDCPLRHKEREDLPVTSHPARIPEILAQTAQKGEARRV